MSRARRPGYLLCQDTYYVDTIKGVGRIYLQSVVGAFCSLAFGKLFLSKLPMTVLDVLNDRVLPFYEEHGVAVEHILTENGREICRPPLYHPMSYSWPSPDCASEQEGLCPVYQRFL